MIREAEIDSWYDGFSAGLHEAKTGFREVNTPINRVLYDQFEAGRLEGFAYWTRLTDPQAVPDSADRTHDR